MIDSDHSLISITTLLLVNFYIFIFFVIFWMRTKLFNLKFLDHPIIVIFFLSKKNTKNIRLHEPEEFYIKLIMSGSISYFLIKIYNFEIIHGYSRALQYIVTSL
jgi:hypothetical protein